MITAVIVVVIVAVIVREQLANVGDVVTSVTLLLRDFVPGFENLVPGRSARFSHATHQL